MATDNRILALLKVSFFISAFFVGPVFAEGQIVVGSGETYNLEEDQYEGYDNASLNGGVVSVSGTLNVASNVSFKNNKGDNGGVIYNEGITSITSESGNSLFGANVANSGGAIYNADTGNIKEISHVLFQRNQGQSGGAINNSNSTGAVGGGVIDRIANASFIENSAGTNQGGAIRNQGSIGNIETVAFISNVAGEGGAISNDSFGIIKKIDAQFNGNRALSGEVKQGGAIFNAGTIESITDSSFVGNQAGTSGGAIYNAKTGSITFNGDNSFTGNIADGDANDIYNSGNVTIADGTTTIGGGISGNGILTIENGATLSIGSTTLEQGTLNLYGTLSASIVNEQAFGKIDVAAINVGENGKLDLMLGSTGKYDFGTKISIDNIVYNDSIYNLSIDGTNIIVETKNIDEISSTSNLSSDAALALVGLANSSDYSMNIASLNAQSALDSGNISYVENESEKLLGDDKPVLQSIETEVQNQILSLASSRMGGGNIGRSGGDVANIDYGVWAQGLMNRTKYGDSFSGDTNGIAVGLDALVKGKYTIGIGYTYNEANVDSGARDIEITSNSLFLYGQYKPSKWYINTTLNYTMSNYAEMATAFGIIVNPEYDVDSFGGQILTGYNFAAGLTPELGVRYLHINQDDYNNGFADIEGLNTNYITGVAGIKYSFSIESEGRLYIRPEVRVAATYDVMADEAVTTVIVPGAAPYIVTGEQLSRFGGELGISLSAMYNEWEFSVGYDLDLRDNYTSHTGMFNVKYKF